MDKKNEYIIEYNMVFINVLAIILLVVMIFLTVFIVKIFSLPLDFDVLDVSYFNLGFLFLFMLFWMVLHEIIHSLFYQLKGAQRKNIVFGAALENGVFYCKCKEYINKGCIMTSLLAPFLLIGVFTYILGLIFNLTWLIFLSIVNISGASGDLMMFIFFLRQNNDIEFKELGDSTTFLLRTSDDLTNRKFVGIKKIKLVEDSKEIEEKPEKKLTISKMSWIFIIFYFILFVLLLILDNFTN